MRMPGGLRLRPGGGGGGVAILLKAYDENDHQYSECVPRVYVRGARAA